MKKKKILDILTVTLLVVVCVVMLFALVARLRGEHHPKIFGYGFGIVLSESMEPNLHKGSFIVIKEQDEYQVDDIITYNHKDGVSVTHRIKYIIDDEIIPKGDANDGIDDAITYDDIVGEVVFNCNSFYFIATVLLLAIALVVFAFIPNKNDESKQTVEPAKETKQAQPSKMEKQPVEQKPIANTNTNNNADKIVKNEPTAQAELKPINTRTQNRIVWPNIEEIRSLEEIRKSKEQKTSPVIEQKVDVKVEPKAVPIAHIDEQKEAVKSQSDMWKNSFKVSDKDKTNI